MTNQITFTVNEEEINMVFNNSSLTEMGKIMFSPDDDLKSIDPAEYERQMTIARVKSDDISEIFSEINKITADNYWFAAKIIIYGGVIGSELHSKRPRSKYSFERIGELVGQMTKPEMMDYTIKVWALFLEHIGMNMKAIKELESDSTEEKKK